MTITRRRARLLGIAAIGATILLQAFNSFACYRHNFLDFIWATFIFVGIPLLPALFSLFLANPLRAVGACALFAPWLLLAYYADCVRPYSGGGASMIYVAVFMWGTLTSFIGALIKNSVTKGLGIAITER